MYVLLRARWKTPDDGKTNCPKHVDFYIKNTFQKLVQLVGFIIRTTLNVFQKTVVLNWHRFFGISPYFGHQVKSMNCEPSLFGSLHWANVFLLNNKPTDCVCNPYFYCLRDQEGRVNFQNCSNKERDNTISTKQCQVKTVIKTDLSNLCTKFPFF